MIDPSRFAVFAVAAMVLLLVPGPAVVYIVAQSIHQGRRAGVVSNPAAPFGGIKQSGFGREGGSEGIEEYLETKYVGLAT